MWNGLAVNINNDRKSQDWTCHLSRVVSVSGGRCLDVQNEQRCRCQEMRSAAHHICSTAFGYSGDYPSVESVKGRYSCLSGQRLYMELQRKLNSSSLLILSLPKHHGNEFSRPTSLSRQEPNQGTLFFSFIKIPLMSANCPGRKLAPLLFGELLHSASKK